MKKIALLSLLTSSLLVAGGYKIPENSINSTALSAAYIANAHGADSAYFNPANMVYEDKKSQMVEADLTYIYLTPVNYSGTVGTGSTTQEDIDSEAENFFIPSLHYVSEELIDDLRVGFSMVVPAGLTKRWEDQPGKSFSHEFSLQVVELNPSVAYAITDDFSVAGGLRMIHSSGTIKSAAAASRHMEAEGWGYGYNLAMTYKPISNLTLATTYRSQIDLDLTGDAKLYFPDNGDYTGTLFYNGKGALSIPIPGALNIAAAYHFDSSDTTLEFTYERTMWSAYKDIDIDFEQDLGSLGPIFDDAKPRDWKDTNAYRVGVTQNINEYTVMAGFAFDETPAPTQTISFELPDSDAMLLSAGLRYQYDASLNFGISGLIDIKERRYISQNDTELDGTFSNSKAYLLTVGAEYKF
jgi:long-chain fatty acid transport protein